MDQGQGIMRHAGLADHTKKGDPSLGVKYLAIYLIAQIGGPGST